MLDQDTNLKSSGPKYINRRCQIRSQESQHRPQMLSRPMTNHQDSKSQFVLKKPSVSSLKKKTIFHQAHPNFPLIKQVYQDTEMKLMEQEQRLKQSVIDSDQYFQDGGGKLATSSFYDADVIKSMNGGSTYDVVYILQFHRYRGSI